MANSVGKTVEVLFEKAIETYEAQMQMMDLIAVFNPDSGSMQNAGNYVWRPVQQHAPIIAGWDLSSAATGIIEETYPAVLGLPQNDRFDQRVDDGRDMGFWERRGEASGKQQATELNSQLATLVKNTGSLFYRSDVTSGYDFIAEGQAIMNERQAVSGNRCFVLNDRDNLKFGKDLAARQTLQGRPSDTWTTGQVGANVAEFDVYTGSYLAQLVGGASPDTTLTATLSFAPEGGTVDAATGICTNVDYRSAILPVVATATYNVGDKVTVGAVQSVGLADKNPTGQLMTFTIVEIIDATNMRVYPKPIAVDDAGLSTVEAASANVDTQLTSADVVARLNIDATAKSNIFWDKNSLEITAGDVPMNILAEFAGSKVISKTLKSGLNMYCTYDADAVNTLQMNARIFTWYGLTNANPSANGVAVTF